MYNCEKCKKECLTIFGSGRFCSRKCSNSRIRTKEIKKKISASIKRCKAYLTGSMFHNKGKAQKITSICSICGIKYTRPSNKISKFCSRVCSNKSPLVGGYRHGSGRSKSGWYKEIYCGSTWELAFLIWALDNDLPIQRCIAKFAYEFEGKKSYLPDFVIGEYFIEIKGYDTQQTKAKFRDFPVPEKLVVLREEELQPIFKYVISTYGKDYYELYEGNPYKQKNNICKECKNPCKRIYCSRRCSVLGNNYYKLRPQSDSHRRLPE